MVLLIDNYDSFSYNLYQLVGTILNGKEDIKVIRNDEYQPEEIINMQPSHIIISPGPGRPKDAGVIEELITKYNGKVPILGVCLGHQAICEALGGTITYAKELMHGKQSQMTLIGSCPIFEGLSDGMDVARYHSLAVLEESLPETLEVVGKTKDGEVMAVMSKDGMTFGLQFHPESIMTPFGDQILKKFLDI